MKYIKADLIAIASQFDVILHGANCQHIMGAGIAKQIKSKFPEAYKADLSTPKSVRKLGTFSFAGSEPIVANLYTQPYPGKYIDYAAVESCAKAVAEKFSGLKIGMPLIGAGLAGGDWTKLETIFKTNLDPFVRLTICKLK